MGLLSLCSIKLARNGRKKDDTSSLKIPLKNTSTLAQEDPEGLPKPALYNMPLDQRSNTGSKLTEHTTRQGGRTTPAGGPHEHGQRIGGPPKCNPPRSGRNAPLTAPNLGSPPVTNECPSSIVNVFPARPFGRGPKGGPSCPAHSAGSELLVITNIDHDGGLIDLKATLNLSQQAGSF